MSSFLTNPYVFGILVTITTAALVYAYQHTLEARDGTDSASVSSKQKTFYKTFGAGVISTVALAYLIHRPQLVSTEPFLPETTTAKIA